MGRQDDSHRRPSFHLRGLKKAQQLTTMLKSHSARALVVACGGMLPLLGAAGCLAGDAPLGSCAEGALCAEDAADGCESPVPVSTPTDTQQHMSLMCDLVKQTGIFHNSVAGFIPMKECGELCRGAESFLFAQEVFLLMPFHHKILNI